ncbi:MAG TPA: ATP-binding protein, partial [Bacteroidales bacterium]|nr:ATP-binding protein [Bacteroidales bacterium]
SQEAEMILDAPPGDYSCYMDALFIEGVLVNLIDNSLKYAKEKPRIRIRLSGDQNTITLEVSDQGPGISEKYIGKVFDKFFRVPTGDRHNVKGHGLGLSYAARVMDQHHGKISVRNNEDAGCTFTLAFPVRQKTI